MILHLGVFDIPYVQPTPPPKKAPKASRRIRSRLHKTHAKKYENITTGDVAEILEARYHVMEIFFKQHEQDVLGAIEESLQGSLESMSMGAPLSLNAFGSATSKIEDSFKKFISNAEMDKLGYPGVPTEAAQRGVSHRFKHPYARRAPRPSFLDTGNYQASFTAWVD